MFSTQPKIIEALVFEMGFAQTDAGMSGAIQNCKIFLAAPTGATPEQPAQNLLQRQNIRCQRHQAVPQHEKHSASSVCGDDSPFLFVKKML